MKTKVCSKCKQEKPLAAYFKRNDRPIGVIAKCKECSHKIYKNGYSPERRSKRYFSQREQVTEQVKNYRLSHREEVNKRNRKWLNADPNRAKAHQKANYAYRNDSRVKICSNCGTVENVEKAHHNYEKPLEIIPLCTKHHRKFDKDKTYRELMMKFMISQPTS